MPPANEILGQQKLQDLLISIGNAVQVLPVALSCSFSSNCFLFDAIRAFQRHDEILDGDDGGDGGGGGGGGGGRRRGGGGSGNIDRRLAGAYHALKEVRPLWDIVTTFRSRDSLPSWTDAVGEPRAGPVASNLAGRGAGTDGPVLEGSVTALPSLGFGDVGSSFCCPISCETPCLSSSPCPTPYPISATAFQRLAWSVGGRR